MAKNDKICMELAFNKGVSYSQRIKVKDFWKFLEDTKPLKPYGVKLDKKLQKKEEQESPKCKRKWYHRLKVFQENGLDKAALATGEKCKLCHDHTRHTRSQFRDTVEESYDELLNDMKAFDERSADKTNTKLRQKKSSTSCVDHLHR